MLRSKKLKNHLYTITYSFEATLTVQTNTQVYQSATFFFRCRITKVKPISKLAPTKIINMFPRQHFNFKLFFPLNFATDQNVFRQQCLSEFQNSNVGGKQIVNRVSARLKITSTLVFIVQVNRYLLICIIQNIIPGVIFVHELSGAPIEQP